jgi:hypothetical protein
MTSKLTLEIDERLIELGERWAREHGKSLSDVLSDYLAVLAKLTSDEPELPPLTRDLLGIAREGDEEDYRRYLEDKYR